MSDAIVSLVGVSKRYTRGKQHVDVLQNLSLDIPRGEFVALMGPSGSGKTTLLNLIGGLDTPTSGAITVAGQRLDALGGSALAHWRAHHVGFVFQFYNLMPMLTVLGALHPTPTVVSDIAIYPVVGLIAAPASAGGAVSRRRMAPSAAAEKT